MDKKKKEKKELTKDYCVPLLPHDYDAQAVADSKWQYAAEMDAMQEARVAAIEARTEEGG